MYKITSSVHNNVKGIRTAAPPDLPCICRIRVEEVTLVNFIKAAVDGEMLLAGK